MNRIGRKAGGKKGATSGTTGGATGAKGLDMDYKPMKAQGAFTEQDIEFMKKAI